MKLLLLILIFIPLKTIAYSPSEGNVTAAFGAILTRTEFYGKVGSASNPFFGGFGMSVLGDLDDRGSLELNLFHTNKVFFASNETSLVAEQTQVVHAGMGYRRWMNESVSLGLVFYSAYPMGGVNRVGFEGDPNSLPLTSASDKVDYGFDISIRKDFLENENRTFIGELKYSLPVTSKPQENQKAFTVFLGIKIQIQ